MRLSSLYPHASVVYDSLVLAKTIVMTYRRLMEDDDCANFKKKIIISLKS